MINHLAWTMTEMGELREALGVYREAEKLMRELLGAEHLNMANLLSNMGITYFNCEEYRAALSCHEQALAINRRLLSPDGRHAVVAQSLDNAASCHNKLGAFRRAFELQREALQIRLALYGGEEHVEVATSYDNIASNLYDEGAFAMTLEYYEKELRVRRALA